MTYEDITYEVRDGTAWITLARPQALNALRWQTGQDLHHAFQAADEDDGVRFVVLTGEGRAFCAGDDIKQVFGAADFSERLNSLMRDLDRAQWLPESEKIVACSKPTIAAVNGIAVGSGMDIALQCDIRIASENARFGSFFVRLGVIGTGAGLYLLPRIIGLSAAYELLYTGRLVDAGEAARLGLVSRVVSAEGLVAAVETLLAELRQGSPLAHKAIKRVVQRGLSSDWRTTDEYSMRINKDLLSSHDHKEAVQAFAQKRAPSFEGR